VAVKRGVIRLGQWRYRLSEADLLWAALMVQGETLPGRVRRHEDALAVLWTMASLFTPAGQQAKYGRWRFDTFTALIRAYSQPINPRWTRDGEFCRLGGRYHGHTACAPRSLDRRDRLQRTPWTEIDAGLRTVVLRWAAGKTDNPVPKAIEFAAPYVANAYLERNPGARHVATIHNRFIASASSKRWTTLPAIQTSSSSSTSTNPIGAALFAAALGGLLGWGLSHGQRQRR